MRKVKDIHHLPYFDQVNQVIILFSSASQGHDEQNWMM
jgi:hypothetical protein